MENPNLAIVYWFYKELASTKNHLELVRQHNPDRRIYGLFGGPVAEAARYRASLSALLDDFWIYPGTFGSSPEEKWIHGDLLLLDWYDKRGRSLAWDTIAIVQWDMLLFDDVANITPGITAEQVFFSGYRDLSPAIEQHWSWTRSDYKHRRTYDSFVNYLKDNFNYSGRLHCCLYIYEVLNRQFFDGYMQVEHKTLGMLEYKDPTLAYLLKLDIYQRDVGVFWRSAMETGGLQELDIEHYPLNAESYQIPHHYVQSQLAKPEGWRLFHPYDQGWQKR